MMRKIDADHLLSRFNEPKNAEEAAMVKNLTDFINSEPSVESLKIQWVETTRKKHTKDCNTTRYGVECDNCKRFQDSPTKFCADCGGVYNGEIIFNTKPRFRR